MYMYVLLSLKQCLGLGKVPSLYSPGMCIIVHGVSTVTVTTCEPELIM